MIGFWSVVVALVAAFPLVTLGGPCLAFGWIGRRRVVAEPIRRVVLLETSLVGGLCLTRNVVSRFGSLMEGMRVALMPWTSLLLGIAHHALRTWPLLVTGSLLVGIAVHGRPENGCSRAVPIVVTGAIQVYVPALVIVLAAEVTILAGP